jgi:L,D-transpeptidase ErfK/SrfK
MRHNLIRFAAIAALFVTLIAPARAEIVGEDQVVTAGPDDTFAGIGEKYLKGFVELRAANPDMNPWVLDVGKEVILPGAVILPKTARREGIVINIAEMRLYDFGDPKNPHIYTIGVGREGLVTPVGTYQIATKIKGPTWHPTPRMRAEDPKLPAAVPPGPDNPLGAYALYIKDTEYRIHGTDKAWSLGRRASSGCIRLYDPDIDALFHHASVKESVQIISEPIKADVKDGAVYLEAHPDEEMADDYENDYAMDFRVPDGTIKMIMATAGNLKDKLDWNKIRDVLLLRPGYPVKISS